MDISYNLLVALICFTMVFVVLLCLYGVIKAFTWALSGISGGRKTTR